MILRLAHVQAALNDETEYIHLIVITWPDRSIILCDFNISILITWPDRPIILCDPKP